MSAQNGLVQRVWSYCNVLRDDGLSYGDYLEQLTFLLFLKMADEQRAAVLGRAFRGELVPQDPSDEPAFVLLDRIRAARAKAGPATGRRRTTVRP